MKKHWAAELIGKPWKLGASGPDSFDCWGLVRYVQRQYFGRDIPRLGINSLDRRAVIDMFRSTDNFRQWDRITVGDGLVESDCVVMSPSRDPIHVGVVVYVDNMFGVIHSIDPVGVLYTGMGDLSMSGWVTQRLYRWTG